MVSFFVLIGIIVLISVLFFRVMLTFLVPLFLAAVFVVIFRPLHHWMLARCRGRQRWAAGLTTAAIMLVVLVPAGLVFTFATIEASSLMTQLDVGTMKTKFEKLRERMGLDMPLADQMRDIEETLRKGFADHERASPREDVEESAEFRSNDRLDELAKQVGRLAETVAVQQDDLPDADVTQLENAVEAVQRAAPGTLAHEAALQVAMREFRDLKLVLWGGPLRAWLVDLANPSDEDLRRWSGRAFTEAQTWLLSVGGATTAFVARLLLGTIIMIVAIYFFLVDGPEMTKAIMHLSPLDDRYEDELLQEFDGISRAVVLATLLSAIAQGLLGGIGYWLAGLDAVFLLMLLTMVMALVPFLGAGSVWVTASFWLYFYEERTGAAIFLAIYGAAIVSMADNVIKPLVLHGRAKLHPLLALLSVLGGVQTLGPIGILIGPMVVVFLQTLLNMLHRELIALDESPGISRLVATGAEGAAAEAPPGEPPKENRRTTGKGTAAKKRRGGKRQSPRKR